MKPLSRLLIALITLLSANHAFSACANGTGNWTDNYSQTWQLSQMSGGVIVGSVNDPVTCGTYTNVSGQFYNDGTLVLNSGAPPSGAPSNCVAFQYRGSINKPGCNSGNGSFSNPQGTGTWNWQMPCVVPSGAPSETTSWLYWDPTIPSSGRWRATVQPTSFSFGGRTVTETVSQFDTCYNKYFNTTVTLFPAPVSKELNSINNYQDIVGYTVAQVNVYRKKYPSILPCYNQSQQVVTIDCSNSQPTYITNYVGATLTGSTVSSSRAGHTMTKTY